MRRLFLLLSLFSHSVVAQQEQQGDLNGDFESAYIAFDKGAIDESYIYLKRSLDENPNHLPSKILMGEVLGLSGYYEDAEEILLDALDENGDPNLIVEPLINVLFSLQKYQAITELETNQLTPVKKARLLIAKAGAYFILKDTQQALLRAEQALETGASEVQVLNAAANINIQSGENDRAMALLKTSLNIDDRNAETYRLLAEANKKLGRKETQITYLETALKLFEKHPLILRDLVAAYISQKRFQDALAQLDRALELSPDDPMAKLLKSWVLSRLDRQQEASAELDELVNKLSLVDDQTANESDELLYISGIANLANGNFEKARTMLSRYLQRNNGDFNAAKMLVEVYKNEGNYIAAAEILEQYQNEVDKDPLMIKEICELYIRSNRNHKCNFLINATESKFTDDPIFLATKARLMMARGKPQLAFESLNKITTDSFELSVQRAVMALQSDNLEVAGKLIDALFEARPDSPNVQNLKASYLVKSGEKSIAEELYRKILKNDPSHFSANYNFALFLFEQKRFKEAKDLAVRVSNLAPENIPAKILLSRIFIGLGNTEQAREILLEAEARSKENEALKRTILALEVTVEDYEKALQTVNWLLKRQFLSSDLLLTRFEILKALGQKTSAIEDLNTLYGIFIEDHQALYDLSERFINIEEFSGAEKSLARALELDKDNFLYRRNLIRVYLFRGKLTEAQTQFDELATNYIRNPDVELLRGDIALAKNNPSKAMDCYIKALDISPILTPAIIGAYQLSRQGIKAKSFEKKFENLAKDPVNNVFATHLLADYYMEKDELEKAKAKYMSIVNINEYPANHRVLNNLANLYIQENRLDVAYGYIQQAYETNQQNFAILDTLGWVLSLQGDFTQGLDYLRRSYSINAQDPNNRFHIAYTLEKLGRINEAKRELKVLLSDFGEFEKRQKAEELMQNI
ncbi:XrtA/PEP-CTERM system TPR-repeat protein PrsT [Glaciecola sp. 1036]|uniref:XrtA/PEP-CTERM system TPR-repeat protein PrsT n=1 Tax=Alteromonadaceae TaxID=72275 RepID=UPI003D049DFE